MDNEFEDFLANAALAKRVSVTPRVILAEETATQEELEVMLHPQRKKSLTSLGKRCVLEVGDLVLARGRIVKKGSNWFFQVTEEG